jgi:CubicO group peptidase (beta-lactamase class C family)
MMSRTEHIASFIDSWVECGALAGAVVGCWHNDQETLVHISGVADVTTKAAMQRDTLFRIYSMTKPITACAFMLLVDDGNVQLDDPVSKFLPAFADMKVCNGGTAAEPQTAPLNSPVTMRHLLTHTSGISYGIFSNSVPDQILKARVGTQVASEWFRSLTNQQLCEHIAATPLSFQPGTAFLYGLGIDVIGHIIEVIRFVWFLFIACKLDFRFNRISAHSGQSLDVFLTERIFAPLGMNNTWFTVPAEHAHRLATCYEFVAGFGLSPSTSVERDRLTAASLLAGGGGLVSCLDDYAQFCRCLLRQGKNADGVQVFSPQSVAALSQDHLPQSLDRMLHDVAFSENSDKAGLGFGLAVSMINDPNATKGAKLSGKGEYGWGGVANTWFYVDPVKNLTTILLTQVRLHSYFLRPPFDILR